jgi:hypothetical protein
VVIGNSTPYYHLARTFLASLAPDYCMFDAQNRVLQKLTALEANSRSYDKAWLQSQLQSLLSSIAKHLNRTSCAPSQA